MGNCPAPAASNLDKIHAFGYHLIFDRSCDGHLAHALNIKLISSKHVIHFVEEQYKITSTHMHTLEAYVHESVLNYLIVKYRYVPDVSGITLESIEKFMIKNRDRDDKLD